MKKKSASESKSMTLHEAYEHAIFQPEAFLAMGIAKQTMMNQRVVVAKGDRPGENAMRKRLSKVGWRLVVHEQWAPGKARPKAKHNAAPPKSKQKRKEKAKKKKKKK